MAAFRDNEDFNWMGDMGEPQSSQKKKGKKKPKKKPKKKGWFQRWSENRQKRISQKRTARNMEKMRKAKKTCEKKGKKLSLNGKDCEEITPQPSSTAYSNNRASIGRDGEAAYLKSLILEQQTRNAMEANTPPPSDDESDWSDDDDATDADIRAAKIALGRGAIDDLKRALGRGGGKRRRKRRRKTRRKKKRKSRRKSRKRRRKRKTKRRR